MIKAFLFIINEKYLFFNHQQQVIGIRCDTCNARDALQRLEVVVRSQLEPSDAVKEERNADQVFVSLIPPPITLPPVSSPGEQQWVGVGGGGSSCADGTVWFRLRCLVSSLNFGIEFTVNVSITDA